ncbi:MAG: MFS transporter [Clostridia bacterium]|nr:MFS transporter [Clostridia bacterium]
MSKQNTKSTAVRILSVICPLVYFASYLTRKNYSVVMSEIIISENITNSQGSLAVTLSLISYGFGQIISGILGDKFKPQRVVLLGLIFSAIFNVALPFCPDTWSRAIVWFLNGFAQSLIWPPLVRIMAATMNRKSYNDCTVNVNIAATVATILLYLTASTVWIRFFNWKYVFFSSAFLCLIITLLWVLGFKKISANGITFTQNTKASSPAEQKPHLSFKKLCASGFILIAIAIICQGSLRDGINDWVPTFIINTFSLESESAILKSIVLPIFTVISLKAVGIVSGRFVKNEVKAAFFCFACGLGGCIFLLFFYTANQYLTLIVSALTCAFMHCVNFFLVCIVPAKFEKYGLVSTMSGIINSFTYIGSAAATYGFGAISDNWGWNACVISWVVIAVLGSVLCLLAFRPWKRFYSEK